MRKVLIAFAGIASLILIVFLIVIVRDEVDKIVIEKYVRNENLPTVKTNWKGTPVDEKGRFVNYEFPYQSKFVDLLKWQLSSNPQKTEKENDRERLAVLD